MKILATALLSLVLHLALGWAWTLGAGLVAGFWAGPRGWLIGAAGVGLGWAALIGYNFVRAPAAVGQMAETMGGLLGNLPAAALVAVTLLLGALLGMAGGGLGTQLRALRSRERTMA